MNVEQLSKCGNDVSLALSISICLFSHVLSSSSAQAHHRFEMRDQQSGRKLNNGIETMDINSEKAEDKQMFDQRENARRDYAWAIPRNWEVRRAEGVFCRRSIEVVANNESRSNELGWSQGLPRKAQRAIRLQNSRPQAH